MSRTSARSNHTARCDTIKTSVLLVSVVGGLVRYKGTFNARTTCMEISIDFVEARSRGVPQLGSCYQAQFWDDDTSESTVLIRVLYSLRDTQRVNFVPSILEKQLDLFPHKRARSHMASNLNRPAAHKERIRSSFLSIMKTFASSAFPAKSYLSMKFKYQGICSHKEIRVARCFESRMRSSSSAQREHRR